MWHTGAAEMFPMGRSPAKDSTDTVVPSGEGDIRKPRWIFSPSTTFPPSMWKVNPIVLNWEISMLCFSPENQKYPWKMLTNGKHLSFLFLFPWWQKKKKKNGISNKDEACSSQSWPVHPVFVLALTLIVQNSIMVVKAWKMALTCLLSWSLLALVTACPWLFSMG